MGEILYSVKLLDPSNIEYKDDNDDITDLVQLESNLNMNWYMYLSKSYVLTGFYPIFLSQKVSVNELSKGSIFKIKYNVVSEGKVRQMIETLEKFRLILIQDILKTNLPIKLGFDDYPDTFLNNVPLICDILEYLNFSVTYKEIYRDFVYLEIERKPLVDDTYASITSLNTCLENLQLGGKDKIDSYIMVYSHDGKYVMFNKSVLINKCEYFKVYFESEFYSNKQKHKTSYSIETLRYFWSIFKEISYDHEVINEGNILELFYFMSEYLVKDEAYGLMLLGFLLNLLVSNKVSYKIVKDIYDIPFNSNWNRFNHIKEQIFTVFYSVYLRNIT